MTRPAGDWEPWSPAEVAARLSGVEAPWAVAAGWALDLFRGRQTRPHSDIEIAVPAVSYPAVAAALSAYEIDAIGDGEPRPATAEALAVTHQTWVREPGTTVYRLDVLREPGNGTTWIFRRDVRIRRPLAEVVLRTPDGIPYVAPEVVLLFKASRTRPKDEADFAEVLPLLPAERRTWLRSTLATVHPGHPWLTLIRAR